MKKNTKKRIWVASFVLTAFVGVLGIYGLAIEPNKIVVRKQTITVAQSEQRHLVKAVHFSDVHLGPVSLKRLEQTVQAINAEKPDIIFFTGDMIDKARLYKDESKAAEILSKLEAPLGKFAVWGNHDIGGGGHKKYPLLMKNAGFTLLKNESMVVALNENKTMRISGLDDMQLGMPSFSVVPNTHEQDVHVVLTHTPDSANMVFGKQVDLILAGHSHGGHIALPFIGPLYTPPYAKEYKRGVHMKDESILSIENGIGTTGIPVRLMASPGFTVINLVL